LVIQAVVSYRSVPRILNLFHLHAPLAIGWIPHFTSVINWTLQLGLGLLQQVGTIAPPWLAIIDHSIDIGTKKVWVVLRVTIDALSERGAAIQLQDYECIGLQIAETVNGETTAQRSLPSLDSLLRLSRTVMQRLTKAPDCIRKNRPSPFR
jgi:hypothetical protein